MIRLAICLLTVGAFTDAAAHFRGLTDTAVEIARPGVRILYTVPSDDLLELDGAGSKLSPPKTYIEAVEAGWQVAAEGTRCQSAERAAYALEEIEALQFSLTWRCDALPEAVTLSYRLFTKPEQAHENFTRVLMADRLMRWRFTASNDTLRIEVGEQLRSWGAVLAPDFFEGDPNRDFGRTLPRARDEVLEGSARTPAADWRAHPRFFVLGVEHILTGPDHVAMVLAIVLVPASLRRLVVWVSTFTVAHSITLALAFFGLLRLSPTTTEPLIAMPVVAVGIENLWILYGSDRGLHNRAGLIFAFGLIHGIGLSYQLSAAEAVASGPPVGRLMLFNLGVECGQLMILGVAAWPVRRWFRHESPPHMQMAASLAIAGAGLVWLIQRLPL